MDMLYYVQYNSYRFEVALHSCLSAACDDDGDGDEAFCLHTVRKSYMEKRRKGGRDGGSG